MKSIFLFSSHYYANLHNCTERHFIHPRYSHSRLRSVSCKTKINTHLGPEADPGHFLDAPLDECPRPISSIRGFERYGCDISRLTITDAGARERICTPNGKATPHRFAQARGCYTVPPRIESVSAARSRDRYGASRRTLRNLALLYPSGWTIEALFCFLLLASSSSSSFARVPSQP